MAEQRLHHRSRVSNATCPTRIRAAIRCNSKLPISRTTPFPPVPGHGPSTRLPDADLINWIRGRRIGVINCSASICSHSKCSISSAPISACSSSIPTFRDLGAEDFRPAHRRRGSVPQAQTATAEVKVLSASKANGQLQADVQVQNLAGHNFPSGVSFRRAFLNFQVLDAGGNVLWASGNTNSDGVIVDSSGNPLATEFFSRPSRPFSRTSGLTIQSAATSRWRSTRNWPTILRGN